MANGDDAGQVPGQRQQGGVLGVGIDAGDDGERGPDRTGVTHEAS